MAPSADYSASGKDGIEIESQCKRKAIDLRERQGRYVQDHYNTLLESSFESEGIQQKRQKLASPKLECFQPSCQKSFEDEHNFMEHNGTHHDSERYLFPERSKSDGSSYSESITSTAAADICFDSDCDEPGSHSSSRSSSNSPDVEIYSQFSLDELHTMRQNFQSPVIRDKPEAKHIGAWSSSPSGEIVSKPTNTEAIKNGLQIASFNQDQNPRISTKDIHHEPENMNSEEQSVYVSGTPVDRATPIAPSFAGTENPSSQGTRSSQSHRSSEASELASSEKSRDRGCNSLQDIIIEVLRPDTEVADILYHSLDGKLECAPPNPNDRFEDSGLSLFSLLELQDPRPIENSGAFTTYAPSSSSGSSSSSSSQGNFSSGGGFSSSSKSQNIGGGNISGPPLLPDDSSQGQLTKQQISPPRSSSQVAEQSFFRCIHNALAPEIFRVTHETGKKYLTCAGPGWNSIQHYREHMKTHHSKDPSSLQCNRCQQKLKNQKSLKDHEKNVDCPIRCPTCHQEFDKKALRQIHQEKEHPEPEEGSQLLEIDDILDEKLKEKLKAYSDSLKKGKGSADAKMEEWIKANTERYLIGRPAKANAKLELGQWYTMFKVLSSEEVPKHPFYAYDLLPSDLAAERILLINEKLIDARIQAHGPPPSGGQQQRDWYQDALRDSLRVAAKTRLILSNNAGQSSPQKSHDMSSSYSQDASAGAAQGTTLSNMLPADDRDTHHVMARSHSAQVPGMHNNLARTGLTSNLFSGNQHAVSPMPTFSSGSSETITGTSTLMPELSTWGFQQNVAMEQSFSTDFAFHLQPDYSRFEPSGSDSMPPPDFQDQWRRQ